jgi:hypothetical protein
MEKRTTVQSFDWRTLAAVRRMNPAIETVCLTNEGGSIDTVAPRDGVPSPWFGGLKLDDHRRLGAGARRPPAGCAAVVAELPGADARASRRREGAQACASCRGP